MKSFNLLTWTQGCPYYKAAIANIFPTTVGELLWCDSMAEEYLNKLSPEDKSGYLRKLTLSSEKVLFLATIISYRIHHVLSSLLQS